MIDIDIDCFQAKNWLSQHIPNTDFRYKNKMPYPVADPYVWDESFQVFHKRLDDEHVVLFDIMQQMKDNPDDVDILNNNRDIFRDHFDYEESQFMECGEPCDADAHKRKHDIFFKTLTWVTNPVSTEYADYAMNWLAQHIKNTVTLNHPLLHLLLYSNFSGSPVQKEIDRRRFWRELLWRASINTHSTF